MTTGKNRRRHTLHILAEDVNTMKWNTFTEDKLEFVVPTRVLNQWRGD
jgi:hypothetical protein